MKKIMFSERYGLEQAVLAGTKTMTRRLMTMSTLVRFKLGDKDFAVPKQNKATYSVGEKVAIAQSYKNLIEQGYLRRESDGWISEKYCTSPGYYNKMFVKAEYMPWQIVIDYFWFERLQDITEQDCLCEGVRIKKGNRNGEVLFGEFTFVGWDGYMFSAREAFSVLIDRVCGRGTWDSNPWVVAYSFHLQRANL